MTAVGPMLYKESKVILTVRPLEVSTLSLPKASRAASSTPPIRRSQINRSCDGRICEYLHWKEAVLVLVQRTDRYPEVVPFPVDEVHIAQL